MAVTDKARAWFQKEHGVSLGEAFEIIQSQRKPQRREKGTSGRVGRGYPFWGKEISLDKVDAENEQLADELAKKTTPATR